VDGDNRTLLSDNINADIHSDLDLLQSIFGEEYILQVGENYRIDNIYYDFNLATIRPDAEHQLNQILDILQKYEFLSLTMASHTDARGSREYNMELSKNRAESALNYLTQSGVDLFRLEFRFYGKDFLINDCGNNCSEEAHQLNRRTEFDIKY
jgi:outer membrane protein OmpA-like peptidoglycan-associated protein